MKVTQRGRDVALEGDRLVCGENADVCWLHRVAAHSWRPRRNQVLHSRCSSAQGWMVERLLAMAGSSASGRVKKGSR